MSDIAELNSAEGNLAETNPAGGNRWSWAAYLGASWTWCIGMFLPVLLIRDYGPWAWVIFAVPNVVGAAAMGWVMRSREMSREYTINHASACRLFSLVTIAFQLFFSIWMLPQLVGPIGYLGVAVIVQSAFTPVTRSNWLRFGGGVALAVSFAAFAGMKLTGVPPDGPANWEQPGALLGLSLVCLAGFLTCPYLDLTFHRARQQTSDADAKFAFGVGFGLLFASMIVLTLFYAAYASRIGTTYLADKRLLLACLAAHWFVQMAYTVHVHAAELARQGAARDDSGTTRAGLGAWLAIGLATGLAAVWTIQNQVQYHDRSIGEALYRVFMSAYGLLFPIYVLLAMGRARVSTVAWLLIAAIASPFYWLAFLEAKMGWASAGVAVIVIGVLIARRFTQTAPADPIG